MKEIEVVLTELTEEEIRKIEPQQILVYDKFLGVYRLEWNNSKKFTCNSKVARYNDLVYFSFKSLQELLEVSKWKLNQQKNIRRQNIL